MNTPTLAIVAAVAAVVIVGGGTLIAARNAEPGDMLYGLRVSLYNDVSEDADVEDNLRAAGDVYAEAESLERSSQLTPSERTRLTVKYKTHIDAVIERIAILEANGDLQAAAKMRTSLRAALRQYDDVFGAVDFSNDSSSSSTHTTTSKAPSSQGSASSIFVQPSSTVTSA